ncbi:AAA domain-containing protein [Vibrio sp. CAIM 722]|uniref:AAA domain-containing protein n=1 Tax=Vibrio eleionomae TaxID=2653505 RepID=A0A7X4RWS7_9VIBR|nr:sigma-54 dependent transcriptional regulator [Vibrio eleionomae]MZI95680.1 AAA domain-containing protein [Vibrio eleionomae]
MQRPSLFMYIQNETLSDNILRLEPVKNFSVMTDNVQKHWIDTLEKHQPNLAIIELSEFTQDDYQRLKTTTAFHSIEIIFISPGTPNPNIDNLMGMNAIFHYRQPVDMSVLSETLNEISIYYQSLNSIGQSISSSNLDQYGLLVGSSASMHTLYRLIRRVAKTDANVLVIGESGSGKELVAQTIHLASERNQQPFIAINCGAIAPELIDSELFGHEKGAFTGANKAHNGVFEQADGGTLFLDEITEMPLEHQVKLLRVLECGEYRPVGSQNTKYADVRVIAATNRDPQVAIEEQFLREDLYFRLSHFPIHVPPLRERGNDIVGLAKHFISHRNANEEQVKTILESAINKIALYDWPGNVRELKHCIERAFILADDVIKDEHLIFDTPPLETGSTTAHSVPTGVPLEELEKAAIMQTLEDREGNKTETAQDLGISVKTLYNKLDKYQSN